jgi:5-methylcytosine-specific restriction protein A
MRAYLYTWNPSLWSWTDLAESIRQMRKGALYESYWSCGPTRKQVGDVFFLMRLGVEPKGIVGCGYVSSSPFLLLHWDEAKRAEGKTTPRTHLLFMALAEKPIVALEELRRRFPAYKWTPQMGGMQMPDGIAEELFAEVQADPRCGFAPLSVEDVHRVAAERRPC